MYLRGQTWAAPVHGRDLYFFPPDCDWGYSAGYVESRPARRKRGDGAERPARIQDPDGGVGLRHRADEPVSDCSIVSGDRVVGHLPTGGAARNSRSAGAARLGRQRVLRFDGLHGRPLSGRPLVRQVGDGRAFVITPPAGYVPPTHLRRGKPSHRGGPSAASSAGPTASTEDPRAVSTADVPAGVDLRDYDLATVEADGDIGFSHDVADRPPGRHPAVRGRGTTAGCCSTACPSPGTTCPCASALPAVARLHGPHLYLSQEQGTPDRADCPLRPGRTERRQDPVTSSRCGSPGADRRTSRRERRSAARRSRGRRTRSGRRRPVGGLDVAPAVADAEAAAQVEVQPRAASRIMPGRGLRQGSRRRRRARRPRRRRAAAAARAVVHRVDLGPGLRPRAMSGWLVTTTSTSPASRSRWQACDDAGQQPQVGGAPGGTARRRATVDLVEHPVTVEEDAQPAGPSTVEPPGARIVEPSTAIESRRASRPVRSFFQPSARMRSVLSRTTGTSPFQPRSPPVYSNSTDAGRARAPRSPARRSR